jgi:hypothetical protein
MALPFRTDLSIVQLPATFPNVGGLYGKNTIVTDPDFGATMVRLTDGGSGGGNFSSMQSIEEVSSRTAWNSDDTLTIARDNGSNNWLFQFNPATMQGTQLSTTLGTGQPYKFNGAYCFSRVTNSILYTCYGNSTQITQNNFALMGGVWTFQSSSVVADFQNILPASFNVTWNSGLSIAQGDAMFSMSFSDTGGQDTGFYMCLWSPTLGYRMINTETLAVTGSWGATGTATLANTSLSNFLLHNSAQSPNSAWANLSPVGQATGFYWQTTTLLITQADLSGHHGLGLLGIYAGGPGGGQFAESAYGNLTVTTPIIPAQAGPPGLPAKQTPPQHYTGDQHSAFAPIVTNDQTLLYTTNGAPSVFPFTSCWMGEMRGLDVTGAISGSQGTVYRICHTFNSGKSNQYIVQNALVGVSQTGNFISFTSDWAGASTVGPLGSTSGAPTGTVGTDARGDVFITKIPQAGTAPTITSANNATFAQGVLGSFTVNTIGSPTPAITESGSLPGGVTFVDNGNGTATLSGTPSASGTFPLTITATNTGGSASQPFTLTVTPAPVQIAPTITSATSVTFRKGHLSSFNVNTTGTPTPAITEVGTLPAGVTFVDNGNGTGTLGGTPTGSVGNYSLVFTAANGVLPNATQPFTLHIVAITPPGTVTGTFQYPNGSPVANGLYQFKLTQEAINVSTAAVVPMLISGTLDASGNLSATFVFNDELQTAYGYVTDYQLTVKDNAGKQVWNETYYLTGTAANLNIIPPTGSQSA